MITRAFTKISAQGVDLPADATEWVAVRDEQTKLIWSATEQKKSLKWAEAKTAADKLDLCGWSWRLPTVEELFLLADRTRARPAIDTEFFPKCKSDWYWTSTLDAESPSGYAWFVDFYGGYSRRFDQDSECFVCAVRRQAT